MYIDISSRQSGKTSRLIEWLGKEQFGILLTYSRSEAMRLKNTFPPVSYKIFYWKDYLEYKRGRHSNTPFKIAVDNADIVLWELLKEELDKIPDPDKVVDPLADEDDLA